MDSRDQVSILLSKCFVQSPKVVIFFLANNGSLQSVQSSGSESSSVSGEKLHYENFSERGASPSLWKRKDVENDSEPKSKKNSATFKMSEVIRKRKYRIGLNLFNKKPEKGVEYLVKNGKCNNSFISYAAFNVRSFGRLSRQHFCWSCQVSNFT